jgi:hypothetical protein
MHQMHISTTKVSSVVLGPKKLEIRKTLWNCIWAERTKYYAMKLNQIRRRIELCMREIILRFEMNLKKKNFFLDSIIHIRIFKQVPKYLATGLKRPSGTYSPPAEASTQGFKCKTNTIPILMHQMRISTTTVSSVVLRPKKLEIRKTLWNCIWAERTKYYAMKLNQIRRRIELCMREIILRFEILYIRGWDTIMIASISLQYQWQPIMYLWISRRWISLFLFL